MSLRNWIIPIVLLAGALSFSATYNLGNVGNVPVNIIQLPLNTALVPVSGATSQVTGKLWVTNRNTILANFCASIYAVTTLGTSGPLTYTVYVNSVATALTVTVGTSATSGTYCDNTHTVTEASGALLEIRVLGNGSNNAAGPMTGFSLTER